MCCFILIIPIIFPIVFFLLLGSCSWNMGDGEKIGTVIKVAKEGILFKTWEGEIVRGGMANGSGGFSTVPFYFTIKDKSLLPIIKQAFNSQKEIKISYTSTAYAIHTNCGSNYDSSTCNFVTAVSYYDK